MFKRLTIVLCVLFFATNSFAQTAGNTSDPKIPYGPGIANLKDSVGIGPLKLSFDFDNVFEKDLKTTGAVADAETHGQQYMLRLGYNIVDRFEPYAKFGMVNMKTKWTQSGTHIKVHSDKDFGAGFGAKVLVFDIPEHKLRLSLDGQYFYSKPDISSVHIDGIQSNISASEFKISQWHIACILSMEFVIGGDKANPATPYSLLPYLGLAYADSSTDIKFKSGATNYDIGNAKNDQKILFITGLDITSPENIALNIEGRFIGETAGSGGCTLKF
jgi:opacity protein-like surface antigen